MTLQFVQVTQLKAGEDIVPLHLMLFWVMRVSCVRPPVELFGAVVSIGVRTVRILCGQVEAASGAMKQKQAQPCVGRDDRSDAARFKKRERES